MVSFYYIMFSIFKKKAKTFLGVDVGSSSIKLVQLSNKGGVISLDTYGTISLGPYAKTSIGMAVSLPDKVLAEAFLDLRQEAEVTTDTAAFSIPFRASLVSLISLPISLKNKVKEVIPYEARKYIPVPISEVSLDWYIVPSRLFSNQNTFFDTEEETKTSDSDGKDFKVLLVAVHNTELEKYKMISNDIKMGVKFFEIEVFSTLRSVAPRNYYPTLIVDIGSKTTKFYVVESGIILKSYFINHGGQSVNESIAKLTGVSFDVAEEVKREDGVNAKDPQTHQAISLVLEEILREANRSIRDFETTYQKSVGKVIFTGGGSSIKGLGNLANSILNIESEIANPFSSIKVPDSLEKILREAGPEFSVALGVALRGIEESV